MSNNNKKMALNLLEHGHEEDENTITEEREEFMIPPFAEGNPTKREAHFLKPLLNPKIQPLPKTPLHAHSSNPNYIERLTKTVSFKGRLKPLKGWKSWVDDLKQTHQIIWKKAGIFDAVVGSTYKIKRDNELIMCLAERWCPQTNTFVFNWGECSVTLEDIMVLGGFPVSGVSPALTSFDKTNSKYAEIESKLVNSVTVIQRNCSRGSVYHHDWVEYCKGMGGETEHAAFLVLWLSRYVFPTNFYGRINPNVFGFAISLVLGVKFAFAPTILASIYRDLALLREKIVSCTMEGVDDGLELVIWAPFQLVQLWAWERFPDLSPKPVSLAQDEPRVARWHDVSKLATRNLRLDIESVAESFVWRPYAMCLRNWVFPKFYCDNGKKVLIDSEADEDLLSFVTCLRVSELVGCDCVMQYLPHRVGLQFGFDQDIPNFVARSNADRELAWSSYAKPLEGLKLYLPPRLFEGDVTKQYAKWWRSESSKPDDHGNDTLLTYVRRRKRTQRKIKVRKLSELLEVMTSPRPLNVVADDSASNITPNQLNWQKDTEIYDYTRVEEDNGDNVKGRYLITNGDSKRSYDYSENKESSTMALHQPEAGNVKEPPISLETKRLCSVLVDEDNNPIKDFMEMDMKQPDISPADVKEENGDGKHLGETSYDSILSRISVLEKLFSMYKAAKFEST